MVKKIRWISRGKTQPLLHTLLISHNSLAAKWRCPASLRYPKGTGLHALLLSPDLSPLGLPSAPRLHFHLRWSHRLPGSRVSLQRGWQIPCTCEWEKTSPGNRNDIPEFVKIFIFCMAWQKISTIFFISKHSFGYQTYLITLEIFFFLIQMVYMFNLIFHLTILKVFIL